MRRILAIALLIAFGSPFAAPLFASTTAQSSLPACCRRNGAHHCIGMMAATPGAPAFQAPPCANYPTPASPVQIATATLPTPALQSNLLLSSIAPRAPSRTISTSAPTTANPKRGPPTLLA